MGLVEFYVLFDLLQTIECMLSDFLNYVNVISKRVLPQIRSYSPSRTKLMVIGMFDATLSRSNATITNIRGRRSED